MPEAETPETNAPSVPAGPASAPAPAAPAPPSSTKAAPVVADAGQAPGAGAGDPGAVRVRHRFIGAACILAIAVLLWELGEDAPPPEFPADHQSAPRLPGPDFVQIHTAPAQANQLQHPPAAPVAPAQPPADNAPAAEAEAESVPAADAVAPESNPVVVDNGGDDNNAVPELVFAPDNATAEADSESSSESDSASASEAQTDSVAGESATANPSPNPEANPDGELPNEFFQVAAFRDGDKAARMARWLRGDGFSAVVRAGADDLHRVFSSADRRHLVALGYLSEAPETSAAPEVAETPEVAEAPAVAAAPSSSSSSSPATVDEVESEPAAPSPFVVQIGAFSDRHRAEQLTARLREQQFSARVEAVRRGGETLFRVRAVGFADRAAAEAARKRLVGLGHAGALTMDTR